MAFLRSVALKRTAPRDTAAFPFGIPAVRTLPTLELNAAVTCFVGENGSGKSTVLEAIAAAVGLPAVGTHGVGTHGVADDDTLREQRRLGSALALTWARRTHRGFFLRAEDFFGFTKSLARMRAEMLSRLAEVDVELEGASEYTRTRAKSPMHASLADMERRYGVDLDANSHGQSFLRLFQNRFVPEGLYLLDEPEAPLSPQSQLALISMLKEMTTTQGSQFIVATHSPILLAFPGATIYTFDHPPVRRVEYEELEHVRVTRDFLIDPERYLRQL